MKIAVKKKQNVKAAKVAKCFNCNTIKSQNYFSKNQWKRRDTFARCKQWYTKIHNFRSNNMKKDIDNCRSTFNE